MPSKQRKTINLSRRVRFFKGHNRPRKRFAFIFLLVASVQLIWIPASIRAVSGEPQCTVLLQEHRLERIITRDAKLISRGNAVIQRLLLFQPDSSLFWPAMVGTLYSHPKIFRSYTQGAFMVGGPFRRGPVQAELEQMLRNLLGQPVLGLKAEETKTVIKKRLFKILQNLNTGGPELAEILLALSPTENIQVSLENGTTGSVDFLEYDALTGEVLIRKGNEKKSGHETWIPASHFYEMLKPTEHHRLNLKNNPLPESEWFRVTDRKIDERGRGSLLTIRPSLRTPHETKKSDYWKIKTYVNGQHSTLGPVFSFITKLFPELARRLKIQEFSDLKDQSLYWTFPDTTLLNRFIDELPVTHRNSIRFQPDYSYEGTPVHLFAREWAIQGNLFLAEQGTGFFHDRALHLLGYWAIPERVVKINRSIPGFLFQILDHPILQTNSDLIALVNFMLTEWLQDFDTETGRFIESMYEAKTNEGRNAVISHFIVGLGGKDGSTTRNELYSLVRKHFLHLSFEEKKIINQIQIQEVKVNADEIPALLHQAQKQLFIAP